MIAPPRELRASLPAELRGMRRDGARLCVVEREIGSDHPHDGRSPRRIPRVRGSARRQLEPHTAGCVAGGSRRMAGQVQLRPGALRDSEWDALAVETAPPHRNVPLEPGETLRAPERPPLPRPRRRAPTHRCCGGWVSKAATRSQTLLSAGEPIRYSYVPDPVPLEHYQTVYAGAPGSVETPSAGRHLTWELLGDAAPARGRRDRHRAALRAELVPGRRRRPRQAAHRGALRGPSGRRRAHQPRRRG